MGIKKSSIIKPPKGFLFSFLKNLTIKSTRFIPGGAGNVVAKLAAIWAVNVCGQGVVGDDLFDRGVPPWPYGSKGPILLACYSILCLCLTPCLQNWHSLADCQFIYFENHLLATARQYPLFWLYLFAYSSLWSTYRLSLLQLNARRPWRSQNRNFFEIQLPTSSWTLSLVSPLLRWQAT